MVEYDLTPIQDFFNNQSNPKEAVTYLYRLIANYAKSVDIEHFGEMQNDIAFLSLFAEYVDSVEPMKNQVPKHE